MSRLAPPTPTDLHRIQSGVSIAASDTTYYSFHEMELYEPQQEKSPAVAKLSAINNDQNFQPKAMRRHDSGYESIHSGSKSTTSSHGTRRRSSLISSSSSQRRPRTRPSIHRASKSTPTAQMVQSQGRPLHLSLSHQELQELQEQPPHTYFFFPSPEAAATDDRRTCSQEMEQSHHPPPPQTTHYWTSDTTRRLEYAAIDAASRGFKGWMRRHVIPDCFMPKENRRLTFDDDTGSVRRYRLELDCEDSPEKEGGAGSKKLGWLMGR
ncbi:hypothetical protein F4780DRAFT_781817 [Xylariomycetidae sp. FL0641]|nr:hypothetical protein F4780DRAFT_781817 [Xylariomycetidae sp. FL0641]